MKDIILIAIGFLVVLPLSWMVCKLQQNLRRQGRMLLELEYTNNHDQKQIITGQKLQFVDLAYEMIERRGSLDDLKVAGNLLVTWGCSLSEFKTVVARINEQSKRKTIKRV